MLLQQIVAARPPGEHPYSRVRSVKWELALDAGGVPHRELIPLADPTYDATRNGQRIEVPNNTRTSGITPNLGVDTLQYVLGWADAEPRPSRAIQAHTAFVDLARRWAEQDPDEPMAQAMRRFYDGGLASHVIKPPNWSPDDVVVISVDEVRVTESPSMWRIWKAIVEERAGAGRDGLCVVCGRLRPLLARMPQLIRKDLIPRADNEVALTSANLPIHGYDFQPGLGTGPICVDCGKDAVANLAAILSDDTHTFSFDGQHTRLAWWVTGGADSVTIGLLRSRPDRIADYLESAILEGRRPRRPKDTGHTFCSVTVSGNYSRLAVHDWIEMPLADAERRVAQWFDDLKIVGMFSDKPVGFGIWSLVIAAGQWQPNRDQPRKGKYIPLFDKAADRPQDLAQLLLRSALHGTSLPPLVLAHIVRRIRTDLRLDPSRMSLLRGALTRLPRRTGQGPDAVLDETQTHPAYLYGRLFAVLESLQNRAYPKDQRPNTTFFHRYFAGAVANPRIAVTQGTQLSVAWIKRLDSAAARERSDPGAKDQSGSAKRAAARYRARIRDLHERIDQPARPLNSAEDQSWFILGYYHQQAHDVRQARAGRTPEVLVPDQIDSDTNAPIEGNEQ